MPGHSRHVNCDVRLHTEMWIMSMVTSFYWGFWGWWSSFSTYPVVKLDHACADVRLDFETFVRYTYVYVYYVKESQWLRENGRLPH